ncbi:MAG: DUF1611 domain-containing protein [Myxococcales bacterium]|nr:MAG: DUF1611 domain-containing protein [Myxococcales bacterium]
MSRKILFGSLARIADLESRDFNYAPIPREQWEAGDYVVGSIAIARGGLSSLELPNGRVMHPEDGDLILGALGIRYATLEVVGSYERVGPEGHMELLSAAGLLGHATSVSRMLPSLMRVDYRGHATRGGRKLSMRDFAKRPEAKIEYSAPTILIVGTSMSAGKTTSAKIIIRQLKRAGLRVVGTKLTGTGRYRDTLAMLDAGADAAFDFVDVGLPSTVVGPEQYRKHLRNLLGLIGEAEPEVVVAEAGASPLEPYNGEVVLDELGETISLSVLCASDPYAVVGVMRGYDIIPDLVAGLATSTSAGVELVGKLTAVRALNLLDANSIAELQDILTRVTA